MNQDLAQAMPEAVSDVLDWISGHPGWVIDCPGSRARLRGPDGAQYATAPSLDAMMTMLRDADLRVDTVREQLALLRAEHPRESIVWCDGVWESTLHGINPVKAPEAWLLNLLLRKEGR